MCPSHNAGGKAIRDCSTGSPSAVVLPLDKYLLNPCPYDRIRDALKPYWAAMKRNYHVRAISICLKGDIPSHKCIFLPVGALTTLQSPTPVFLSLVYYPLSVFVMS